MRVKPEKVPFQVVKLWRGDIYEGYCTYKSNEDTEPAYAIYVNGMYFLLGGEIDSIYVTEED